MGDVARPMWSLDAVDAARVVALGDGGTRTAGQLRADVQRLANALPARDGEQRLALAFREDRYAFTVSLLAAFSRGWPVTLVSEPARQDILAVMERDETAQVLHDTPSAAPLNVARLLRADPAGEDLPLSVPEGLPPVRFARLTAGQLRETEIPLEALWEQAALAVERTGMPNASLVHAQVPAGHAFGLVAGVLAPLRAGVPFSRGMGGHLDGSGATAADRQVLVTVPSRLQGAPASRAVCVPAGALDDTQRTTLGLDSDRLVELDVQPYPAFDLADGTLRPAAAEGALKTLPQVRDAGLLHVEVDGQQRLLLALVCDGALPDEAAVRERLQTEVPLEARQVEAVPRDGLGAADPARLLPRFGRRADGRPYNETLAFHWGNVTQDQERWQAGAHVDVPADYRYFDGHFLGYPILPGAAQLQRLVMPALRHARPDQCRVLRMTRLKFLGRIEPGARVEIRLSGRDELAQFELRCADKVCASGSLHLAPRLQP